MKDIREGYKMTELGEIPKDWEVKELNDITSVITKGTTPTSYGYDFEDEGINFIKIESINDMNGTLLEETFSKISEECHKKLSRSILEENDILFAIAGATIGKCAITTKESLPANTNQALAIIRLNKNIDSKFIFHQLRGPLIQNKIDNLKTNTAQPNLNLKQIGEFTIFLPTLKEQKKLSLILNCVDEQIQIADNLIEKTKELKKGLMKRLLKEGIGHNKFKETEIGRIPEEWKIKKLSEICEIKGGKRLPKGVQLIDDNNGFPYIRVADMYMGGISIADIKYVPLEAVETIENYRIDKEDLFISVAGTIGIVGEVPESLHKANLTENADKLCNIKINKNYLLWCLQSELIQKIIAGEKTTNAQPKLALTRIKEFSLPIPSNDEQKQIDSILSSIDDQVSQYESKKEKLQELKKGLMQKLLTGKIRVKV